MFQNNKGMTLIEVLISLVLFLCISSVIARFTFFLSKNNSINAYNNDIENVNIIENYKTTQENNYIITFKDNKIIKLGTTRPIYRLMHISFKKYINKVVDKNESDKNN